MLAVPSWSFQANLTHSLISTQVTTPKETAPPPPTPAQVKQERKELLARVRVVLEASGCDVLAPSAEGSIGVRVKGCTPIIHPTTKPPPILSSPASGTKIASSTSSMTAPKRSFSGHDVATPLLRSAHCSAV